MTATGKLPVWATVFAAWRYLATQWRIVLPLAALLLLTGPAMLLWQPVAQQIVGFFHSAPYIRWFLLKILMVLPFLVLAAVALIPLHRAILTGPAQRSGHIPFRLGRREVWYFLFVLAMEMAYEGFELAAMPAIVWVIAPFAKLHFVVADYGPVAQMMVFPTFLVLSIPIIALVTYVPFRLSLALPAIATDRERPLLHAWTVSRGNGWRLVAVLWIALLPVFLVTMVLTEALDAATSLAELEGPILIDREKVARPDNIAAGPVLALNAVWAAWLASAYTLLAIVEGAALSLSYRALGGMDEPAKANP